MQWGAGAVLVSAMLTACGGGGSMTPDVVQPADASDAGGPATFTQVYAVISANCMPCHVGGTDGMLVMTTRADAYMNLVGVAAAGPSCGMSGTRRVVAGDVTNSLLFQKLNPSPSCGGQMPLGRTALSAADIELFRSWIAAGAMNN